MPCYFYFSRMKQTYHVPNWELWLRKKWRNIEQHPFSQGIIRRIPPELRNRIPFQSIPLWIASILTGLVAVGYEHAFELFEGLAKEIYRLNPYWLFLTAPIFFTLSRWLVTTFAPHAKGSGIPQLMAAVESADTQKKRWVDSLLNLPVLLTKLASSLVLLLGGGAIGREGPTLQIAGSIFQLTYRFIPTHWHRVSQKIMLITGGASGLAAAFNTPLGGIVYVVEELTKSHIGQFRTAVFSAVIIAGMTAQLFLGSYLYLGFPRIKPLPLEMIGWVILIASIGGLLGAYFTRLILAFQRWLSPFFLSYKQWITTFILGLLFATLVNFVGEQSMGTGKSLINTILFQPETETKWYLFPARFTASILSFLTGGAGGIFATSLSSGAALGDVLNTIFQIAPEHHNLMVLLAMIGFLTGVTRTPFTSAILVLEMTDRHSAIFYFLLAGMLANVAASFVLKRSFYEIQKDLLFSQFRLDEKKLETKNQQEE